MKRRKAIKRILYFVGAIVIIFAAWNLRQIGQSTQEAQELYDDLAQKARESRENEADSGVTADAESSDAESPDVMSASEAESSDVMSASEASDVMSASETANEWLTELQNANTDLVAWIKIPDTNIDYPVMQSKYDGEFYLHHDFEKREQFHGTPFLDVNCDLHESENLIVYGHNMKDGTMFQNLMKYREPAFCESNGTISFFTPEQTSKYKVFMVMVISSEEAEAFPYYTYTDLTDENLYREYLTNCSAYSIWNSGESVPDGTPLLTLSTCEYTKDDGRLVVIARRCN